MSKEKQLTLKLDVRSAASVRQILFDHQKGYTYNESCVPERILDIRSVIQDIDNSLESILS
jgi:hypothetical protein